MRLLEYINQNPMWETKLTQEPYNLKVIHENDYFLIKYYINADFSKPLVREARGVIFKQDINGQYVCVCHPFDKFFNYSEGNADNVDWSTASVLEKVDGSLIKLWYDNEWHISTNGCIDAFKAITADGEYSFGDLFMKALAEQRNNPNVSTDDLFAQLNKTHVYMFELVSPYSRLVVNYLDTALYYIGERDMITDKELYLYADYMKDFGIRKPKQYNLNNLNDVIALTNTFSFDEEGCVVCDADYRRVKVKGLAYLNEFHRLGQSLSNKRIVEAILNETIDDWAAYNPDVQKRADEVLDALHNSAARLDAAYQQFRKEIAAYIYENHKDISHFLFDKLDHPNCTGFDYILRQSRKNILNYIKEGQK